MMRVLLALLLLTTPALAAPRTLTMKREEASNLHMAGQRGAINRRHNVTVIIELRAKGVLAVTSVGADHEHVLHGSENTDEDASWRTTWTGTWKQRAAELTLDLVLAKDTCTKHRTSDRFAPETLTCKVPSKRAKLVCTSEQIEVQAGATSRKQSAWRCSATDGELGETVSSWVVGTTTCIKTLGGMMSGDSFAPC